MAVRSREDFFSMIKERLGDDSSEQAISFLEDVTDTYNDLETKAQGDGTDWQTKYNEMAQRYRDRFFEGSPAPDPEPKPDEPTDISIDDLFTTKE